MTIRTSRARGFSLVEVLVTLVIMAVGMLGIAALYVEGLRAGRSSLFRSAAVNLAADMADRIEANPAAAAAYAGTGPGSDEGCVNGEVPCTPDQMAADDWFHWQAGLEERLPIGSNAAIEYTAPAGPAPARVGITLTWPEPGQPEPARYRLTVQL